MTVGANDLTTLADVKAYLRLTTDKDDALLQTLITNCSAFIETWTNRIFKSTDYTDVMDGIGWTSRKIAFQNYPCTAVSAVTIDDIVIPAASNTTEFGYRFNENFLFLNGYSFCEGFQNVVVSYTAGYSATPSDVAQACIQIVALRYRELERIGQHSKVLNGENVNFTTTAVQPDVAITLGHYTKVVL